MDFVSVTDAARLLERNPSRIRALIKAGLLSATKIGGRWLIPRDALERRQRYSPGGGRPLAAKNAWRVMIDAEQHRASAPMPVAKLRRRASILHYMAHLGALPALRRDERLVATGVSAAEALGLDIIDDTRVEAYCRAENVAAVVREHGLVSGSRVNVLLRSVTVAWPFVPGARVVPTAVAAVDLVDAHAPRLRRAGEAVLPGAFISKFVEVLGREGTWISVRWSDGGRDRVRPAALKKAIELGTDARYEGRVLLASDVARIWTSLCKVSS